jgi:hypothetical protein
MAARSSQFGTARHGAMRLSLAMTTILIAGLASSATAYSQAQLRNLATPRIEVFAIGSRCRNLPATSPRKSRIAVSRSIPRNSSFNGIGLKPGHPRTAPLFLMRFQRFSFLQIFKERSRELAADALICNLERF